MLAYTLARGKCFYSLSDAPNLEFWNWIISNEEIGYQVSLRLVNSARILCVVFSLCIYNVVSVRCIFEMCLYCLQCCLSEMYLWNVLVLFTILSLWDVLVLITVLSPWDVLLLSYTKVYFTTSMRSQFYTQVLKPRLH